MTLRILAVIAAIIAIIFFAVGVGTSSSPHDTNFGLMALAAAVGFIALEGVVPSNRVP